MSGPVQASTAAPPTLSVDPNSDVGKRALGKVTWYLYIYIFVGEIFYQLDRANIGMAQLTMSHDIGIDAKTFGFAAGIFGLAAFVFQVPAAKGFEIFGARRWIAYLMTAWGAVCLLQGFVTAGWQLATLRFLLGTFEAGFLPALYVIIGIWFRGKQHGAAQATRMIGQSVANVGGALVGGWLLGQSIAGLAGWQTLFVLEGAFTVVWGIVSLLIIYDSPEKARWLTPDEKAFMATYLAEYEADKKKKGAVEKSSFWETLKNPDVLLLFFAFGVSGWVASTFTFFIPTLMKQAATGLSTQMVGVMTMCPYIVYAIVGWFWGKHADKTERHWHTCIPLLWSAVGVLLYPWAKGSAPLSVVAICLVQAGTAGFIVNFWPAVNLAVGRNTLAKGTALISAASQIFTFFAPIYFGWALDVTGNTNLGLYTTLVSLAVNFTCLNIFFLRYKRRAKAAEAKQASTPASATQEPKPA